MTFVDVLIGLLIILTFVVTFPVIVLGFLVAAIITSWRVGYGYFIKIIEERI